MATLNVNTIYRDLLPRLQSDEYEKLREDLKINGCKDPILTCNGTIVDGHNRFEICTQEGIPFESKEISLDSDIEIQRWILIHQLGRRNLTDYARIQLAKKLTDVEEMATFARGGSEETAPETASTTAPESPISEGQVITRETTASTPESPLPDGQEKRGRGRPKGLIGTKTTRALAKKAGTSPDTVSRVNFIDEHADDATKKKLETGETTINAVFTELKEKESSTNNPQTEDFQEPDEDRKKELSELVSFCFYNYNKGEIDFFLDKFFEDYRKEFSTEKTRTTLKRLNKTH